MSDRAELLPNDSQNHNRVPELELQVAQLRGALTEVQHESVQFGYDAGNSKVAEIARLALVNVPFNGCLSPAQVAEAVATARDEALLECEKLARSFDEGTVDTLIAEEVADAIAAKRLEKTPLDAGAAGR